MDLSIGVIVLVSVLGLLGIGVYGLLASRNLIKVIIALQIMVKGAMVALVMAGHIRGAVNFGQSLALTVIVTDTIVAVVGLTLAVQIRQRIGTMDIKDLTKLRR